MEAAAVRVDQPVERRGRHGSGVEPVLLVPLQYDQRVAPLVLERDIPRFLGVAARAADCEAGALTERVERQPAVLTEHAAIQILDRPRIRRDVTAEELCERPLADEADAGAVGLVVHAEAGAARALTHLGLG